MAGIIVDIDGTLLSGNNGIDKTIAWVNQQSKRYRIYLVTGRPEEERANTTRALKKNGVKYNRLYMKNLPDGHENTVKFKKQKAEDLKKADNIIMAVDNDPDSRAAYSSVGIPVKSPSSLPNLIEANKGFWQGIF